jgi:hypothetical protein
MKRKYHSRRLLALCMASVLTVANVPLDVIAEDAASREIAVTEAALPEETSVSADFQSGEAADNVSAGLPEETGAAGIAQDAEPEETASEPVTDSADEAQTGEMAEEMTDGTELESEEEEAADTAEASEDGETEADISEEENMAQLAAVSADEIDAIEVHGSSIADNALQKLMAEAFGAQTTDFLPGLQFRLAGSESYTSIGATALTSSSLVSGVYEVQKRVNKGSIFKPSYEWQTLGTVRIKVYYKVTFQSSGAESGGVVINGGDAFTGEYKVTCVDGTAEAAVSFQPVAVDGYDVSVKAGEESLAADENGVYSLSGITGDQTVTVSYEPQEDKSCQVVVSEAEHGTVTVNGKTDASVKVENGKTFTIEAVPASGYAVTGIWLSDGTNTTTYEAEELSFDSTEATLTVTAGEGLSYTAGASFTEVGFTVKDSCEVKYYEGMDAAELKANIFAAVVSSSVPELTVDDVEIQYKAGSIGSAWKDLDYTPGGLNQLLHHAFGQETEQVKITFAGDAQYPSFSTDAVTVTLVDGREETVLTLNEGVSITYSADEEEMLEALYSLLIQSLADTDGNAVEYSKEDITIAFTGTAAAGEQEVKVTYAGDATHKKAEATVTVTVNKAKATVSVASQSVTYGDDYSISVSTNPASVNAITVIAGIDGNAAGYVSIFIPTNVREMLDKDILGFNPYQSLVNALSGGASAAEFAATVRQIIRIADQIPGMNVGDSFTQILEILDQIPEGADIKVYLEQKPVNAGVYLVTAVTVDENYETAVGVGYLTIAPKASSANVTLAFNQECDTKANIITYEQMEDFWFGGHLLENNEEAQGNVRTLYAGISFDGTFHTNSSPILEPGIYTETVYVLGGNYFATPITRVYTIQRQEVEIIFDTVSDTVFYDGEPHALTAGVYADGERIAEATITYAGVDSSISGYYSKEAPSDAGVYAVTAVYKGDALHQSAVNLKGQLTILRSEEQAVLRIADIETVYGADLTGYLDTVKADSVSEGLAARDQQTILSGLACEGSHDTAGEHAITATVPSSVQKNYKYTIKVENGVHTVTKIATEIRFEEDSVEVEYDGQAHALSAGVFAGTERIADAVLTYQKVTTGAASARDAYYSTEAPTEPGTYLVTASYSGDETHQAAENVEGTLVIREKQQETEETKTPETEETKAPETEETKAPETEETKASETENPAAGGETSVTEAPSADAETEASETAAESETEAAGEAVNTGDTTNVAGFAVACITSFLAVLFLFFRKRKMIR